MRVEHVSSGKMIRIPRKLKKALKKEGLTVTCIWKGRYHPWEVFTIPDRGWRTIIKVRKEEL